MPSLSADQDRPAEDTPAVDSNSSASRANRATPSTTSDGPNDAVLANTLLLRRQLLQLTKNPVDGFSAGIVDFASIASIVQISMNSNSLRPGQREQLI